VLTAVVLAKNEADSLSTCLKSLSFCDHIVVVDDQSTDATATVAKSFGASILKHPLDSDFSESRNWAQHQVKSPWLLYIDADEQVSPQLAASIRHALTLPGSTKGFYIHRQDLLWGHQLQHGDLASVWLLRLARRGAGQWQGVVHEIWHISGATSRLSGPLLHRPHQTIAAFLSHLNTYSTLRAQELYQSQPSASFLAILVYPPAKFLYLWIIKLGFLDGTPGFIHAMAMAFYSFLVRGKHYLLARGIPHA